MLRQKEEKIKALVADIITSGNKEQDAADLIEDFISDTLNEVVTPNNLIKTQKTFA